MLTIVIVFIAGFVMAAGTSATASGTQTPPRAAGAHHAWVAPRAGTPAGSVPVRPACPVPSRLGFAACDALVRTDPAASRQGTLTPGVAPQGYGPADLQSAYALPSATAGAGVTVAIVDAYNDPTAAADLAVYRKQFGLPPCTVANGCFRQINQRGGHAYPALDRGWATEISLDLDMVSAACPKCRILLVEANSNAVPDLGAAVNEAVAQGAKYISNSYGAPFPYDASAQALIQQWDTKYYNHPGVVVTASTGDYGYAYEGEGTFSPDGGFPAAFPQVVAVGGTSLTRDPSSTRGWVESAWSGTGSGCATAPFYAKPSWQHDVGCSGRTNADVSAVAAPATGVAVYDSYGLSGWSVFGGTSAASPLIAAAYALAGTPAGGTYPGSYPYAHTSALNDITTGSNGSGCAPAYVCTAGPGYDGPTGLGTPRGVDAFAAGPHGTVSGTVTDAATGAPVAGVQVNAGPAVAYTNSAGQYSTSAVDGSYTPTAARFGYASKTGPGITVTSGATVTANFTLARLPVATISGTVTDASGRGWPLYAQIRVPGTPVVAYTNPATGAYRITVPAGPSYQLDVSAQYPGYRASTATVHLTPAGTHRNIGLKIDQVACTAPGYQPVQHGLAEDFSSGTTPKGWTVTNNQTPAQVGWVFNNPRHLPNYTGGTGGFAVSDGLNQPYGGTTLTTPVLDMSGDSSPVLSFKQDVSLNDPGNPNSTASVSVSTDGGHSWATAYQVPSGQSVPGPSTVLIPLPQAARQPRVQLRFELVTHGASWEVDDVFAGNRACQRAGDGLVVGQVHDRNTGQVVNGATVAGGGQQAVTAPEPGDPAVGGGLYWLPAPAGPLALRTTASGYATGTAHVTVASGRVTSGDLSLAAGRVAVAPATVPVSVPMGSSATARVRVTNTGSAPVTVRLTAQAGPVTLAGQSRPAAATAGPGAGAPPQQIRGHYSPGLGPLRAARTRQHRSSAAAGGTWVAGNAPEVIYDNAAATDPATGDVYSVGGYVQGTGTVSDAFVYHPARRSWSGLPAMPRPRLELVAGMIGGKLYVTDGLDTTNNYLMQAALDVYDPHTGLWSSAAPIPHAGAGAGGAVLGGKMYVVGGCPSFNLCTYRYVQVYDPVSNTWHQAAPYPRKISYLGCGAIGGKLYCAGGYDHDLQTGTSAAYVYDPAANTWNPIASMPADVWGGASAAASGQLLVSGGITRFSQILTNQGYAYDPARNRWSPLPNAPEAVYLAGAACGFYTIGGVGANGPVASSAALPGYTGCDGGTGVPWLTGKPAAFTLAPGQSTTVTLTLSASPAAVPQPGSYAATLTLDSGAPYPAPRLPVTLNATPPKSWGQVTGTVTGLDCNGTKAPIDAAAVQITWAAGGQTLTTGTDGRYGLWLPSSDSPLSLIATAANWLAGTATAHVKADATSTVNIALKRASCG